nr:hypothetical protein [uncultured Tyzzerella sp.]
MSLYNYSNKNFLNCNCDSGCDYAYNQVCTPDKIDSSCSLNSIRKTLIEIINAVKNEQLLGFNIDVEIVTNDGISNVINFSKLTVNSIYLTKTTLIAPGVAISLCDIAKMTVLTSTTTGSTFNSDLLNGIKNIATTCNDPDNKNYYGSCGSCGNADVQCAQGIQNYINQNINAIDTISYNGNSAQVETVNIITDITKEDVLKTSTLSTTEKQVSTNATIQTTTTPVVNAVNLTDTNIVSEIQTTPTTVLTDVTETTKEVSAPITVNPIDVVSQVETTDNATIVTNVTNQTKNVVNQVSSTTGQVVTGIGAGTPVTGVISNIDTAQNITPTAINIPELTSTGTGVLQVTIAQQSIDGTNPTSDIVLNVKVGNQDITFNGNTQKYVLDNDTKVIGGSTQEPRIVTVNQPGSPTTDNFIKTISSTTIPVIDTITPVTTTTKLVNNITTTEINNVQTPTTATVIESIQKTTDNIENITNTTTIKPTDLVSTTTENVLNGATISSQTENVLATAQLTNTTTSVISDIATSTQDVYLPFKENINGRIFAAGDGIMGVSNTNGDITVYSICDINSVNTIN